LPNICLQQAKSPFVALHFSAFTAVYFNAMTRKGFLCPSKPEAYSSAVLETGMCCVTANPITYLLFQRLYLFVYLFIYLRKGPAEPFQSRTEN
jgi:hypothetical protein